MSRWKSARRAVLTATASFYAFQATGAVQAAAFVNEFHYDNSSTDVGEFFEIAGTAGTDLSGWSLELYNGTNSQRSVYRTVNLSGVLTDQNNGFGFETFSLPTNGIQNGSPDGFALVDNLGSVIEFLSYEGSFTAASGPAVGMTSTDIGVRETSSTPVGHSLQRVGTGTSAADFTWASPQTATTGAANTGQVFSTSGTGNPGGDTGGTGPNVVAIFDIQGNGHRSTLEGETVSTSGIVTGLTSSGYYVQDPVGDGDDTTSDGIFVFTGSTPSVAVGDEIEVTGDVVEFRRSSQTEGLTLTEIAGSPTTNVLSSGNTLPAAVTLGDSGRAVPTESIDSDGFGTFNPETDGIDYYESLEGMLVTLPDAQAVSTPNRFGEVYAVGDNGANATGLNALGGLTLTEGDFNPERIQIQDNGANTVATTEVGDGLGDVMGHISYSFSDYEIVASAPVDVVEQNTNTPEMTTLVSGPRALTVATFNALLQDNFSAPSQDQIDAVAAQIVANLQSPDVLALQEVQRDFANGGADALIQAIIDAGGPEYQLAYVESQNNTTSILPAFLYTDNVSLDGVELIPGGDVAPGPFDGGQRVPLVATFSFEGETFTVVNNHFDSKSGSSPAFGETQPPVNGGETDRLNQAGFVNNFVDDFLATDPEANVIVLGDLNEFAFEDALLTLMGEGAEQVLKNADELVADVFDRFTFNFEGNSQALDHILLTLNMFADFELALDFLHINAGFLNGASDHDPILLRIALDEFTPVPLPGAVWMMLLGLAGFGSLRRRKTNLV